MAILLITATGFAQVQTGSQKSEDGAGNISQVKAGDQTGFLKIKVLRLGEMADAGAEIQINGKRAGKSPLTTELATGEYTIVITSDQYYHAETRQIKLGSEGVTLEIELKPKFGSLTITARPDDAEIVLNGKAANRQKGKPATYPKLLSGEYTVEVKHRLYKPQTRVVALADQQVLKADFDLAVNFGNIEISASPPGSTISILGTDKSLLVEKGKPSRFDSLISGQYTVLVAREHFIPQEMMLVVSEGETTRKDITLTPDFGAITISSTPPGATVVLDHKLTTCVTPCDITYIKPGEHTVAFRLDGYAETAEKITVTNGSQGKLDKVLKEAAGVLSVIGKLPDGTSCDGQVYVDDVLVGSTPWKGEVRATKHRVVVQCDKLTGVTDVLIPANGRESLSVVTGQLGRLSVKALYEDKSKCDAGIVRAMGGKGPADEPWGNVPFDEWVNTGAYTVRVDCIDGSGDAELKIDAGEHEDIKVLVSGRPTVSAWPWVTFVLGAATVAGGGVLNFYGNQDLDLVASAKQNTQGVVTGMSLAEAKRLEDRGTIMNTGSIAMYAIGGAALLTGLIAGVVDVTKVKKARERSKQHSLIPSGFFVPGGAGIGIVGGF